MIWLSFLFFGIASMLNAVMDTLQFHFYSSVFSRRDPKFWDPAVSWKGSYVLPFTKYKLDAWHMSKSLMIIFQALACVILLFGDYDYGFFRVFLILIIYGIIWNGVFNLFWNYLLVRK